jgi:hypothetical protein
MAKNGKKIAKTDTDESLKEILEYQKIGNRAVHKVQAENRRLGIPNWYSINGQIISDIELAEIASKKT